MSKNNVSIQTLDKAYALTTATDVTAIASILKEYFGITHFCYLKSFHDNTHLLLCTDPEWVKCFYLNYYQCAPYHKIEKLYSSGYELWEAQPDQTVYTACKNFFNIAHGITVIQKQSDGTEFLNFAAKRENSSILNFYLNNFDVLLRFGMYFKDRGKKLIQQANRDRLLLPRCLENDSTEISSSTITNSIKQRKADFLKKIAIKRYYFTESGNVYLTEKEYQCINHLISGKTTKEIARLMNVSIRTAEAHLDNMRIKLNCRNKMEMLAKLINSHLFK